MSTKALAGLGVALMLASVTTASAKPNQAFLTDAVQGNLAEISMGQLAQKNGGSDGVRSFGQMLVQDHSAANEKAKCELREGYSAHAAKAFADRPIFGQRQASSTIVGRVTT